MPLPASGAEGSDAASGLLGNSIFLPDANGVLRLAELTYDDAPWMSSTLRERPDGGGVQFVHESVSTKLAESLGARSLRYLLLLEEKLTDSLPCPGIEPIKRALSDGGSEAQLLLDLLEVADSLGARAVNFMIDGRKHPTQSLLSPALATFRTRALCMFMPGITLNTEQLCKLQHPTGGASSAHGGRASAKLLSIYAIAEVPCVVSGPAMYLFDPSGKYLTASVKTGDSSSGSSSRALLAPQACIPLVPNELPNRFPDQFAPLALFGFRPNGGRPMDGTLIRLRCARSSSPTAHLATQFWSIPRARTLVRVLRKHASTLLLGLDHVEAVTTSEWAPNEAARPLQHPHHRPL